MKIKATQMDINKLSVVSTADNKGIAIKPLTRSLNHLEVCVSVRDGVLLVAAYVDGVDKEILLHKLSLWGERDTIDEAYEIPRRDNTQEEKIT